MTLIQLGSFALEDVGDDVLMWHRAVDRHGDAFLWTYVLNYHRSNDCAACTSGRCMQRLERYGEDSGNVIVHACGEELS